MPVEDSYIAAIARRHNLTVTTGNESGSDDACQGARGRPRRLDRQSFSQAWRRTFQSFQISATSNPVAESVGRMITYALRRWKVTPHGFRTTGIDPLRHPVDSRPPPTT